MTPKALTLAALVLASCSFVCTVHASTALPTGPGKLHSMASNLPSSSPHFDNEISPPSPIADEEALKILRKALSTSRREIGGLTEAAVVVQLQDLGYSSDHQLGLDQFDLKPKEWLRLLYLIPKHGERVTSREDRRKAWASTFISRSAGAPMLFSLLKFEPIKAIGKIVSLPRPDGDDKNRYVHSVIHSFIMFRRNALQPKLGWTQSPDPSLRLQIHGGMLNYMELFDLFEMFHKHLDISNDICLQHSARLQMFYNANNYHKIYIPSRKYHCPNPTSEPVYNISASSEHRVNWKGVMNIMQHYSLDGSERSCVIEDAAEPLRAALREAEKGGMEDGFYSKFKAWLDRCEKKYAPEYFSV